MNAQEVRDALRRRHPASGGQFPGPWTVVEEWMGIDVLAFSAWQSQGGYRRIGYEVKISRADLRRELLQPGKRTRQVAWCHEFYFAVPVGLLTAEELRYVEPEWGQGDWCGEPCPGVGGRRCARTFRRKTHFVQVPVPTTGRWYGAEWTHIRCPACNGKGTTGPSRVESEAPTCWIPRDVGCVVVTGAGARTLRRSPRRDAPALGDRDLGALVRWISMRPDPRHAPRGRDSQGHSSEADVRGPDNGQLLDGRATPSVESLPDGPPPLPPGYRGGCLCSDDGEPCPYGGCSPDDSGKLWAGGLAARKERSLVEQRPPCLIDHVPPSPPGGGRGG